MSKWYGNIGFAAQTVEVEPGYYDEVIEVRAYFGDLYKHTRVLQPSNNGTNDNINISNQLSILADPYARNHCYSIRYVEFSGAKWKVTNVDASQYPRLILTLGGLDNGN